LNTKNTTTYEDGYQGSCLGPAVFLSVCLCCGLFICLFMLWSFYPSANVVHTISRQIKTPQPKQTDKKTTT
jgi:hypothetical protein